MLRFLKQVAVFLGFLAVLMPAWAQLREAQAEVLGMEGEVRIRSSATEGFRPARPLDAVMPGTGVRTLPDGRACIFFSPSILVMLGPNSQLEVVQGEFSHEGLTGELTLKIVSGMMHFTIAPAAPRHRLNLQGHNTVATVTKGKGAVVVGEEDRLISLAGPLPIKVKNTHSGREVQLPQQYLAISTPQGNLNLSQAQPMMAEKWGKEAAVAALVPPPRVHYPPLPTTGPLTLEEQVKTPWPILPPVDQEPHIWLFGTFFKNPFD